MTLVLGSVQLPRTESFRVVRVTSTPRRKILGASSGKIDESGTTHEPASYRLVALVNNSDCATIEGYCGSYVTLSDAARSFSKNVKVERVDCEALAGHDFSTSEYCWRVSVEMVLSNS